MLFTIILDNIPSSLIKIKAELYIDQVFDLFIDNQIDAKDLKYLLSKEKIKLPEEFYNLSKIEQKKYLGIKQYIVDIQSEERPYYVIFNNFYFYYLVTKSRQSKYMTQRLIDYVNDQQDMVVFILAMRNIYLDNVDYFNNSKYSKIIIKNNCHTIFDLFLAIENNNNKKFEETRTHFYNYFKNQSKGKINLEIDFDRPFNKFCVLMELILNELFPIKELNTLKLKFLIYRKEYLKGNDYKEIKVNGLEMIKRRFNNIKKKGENIDSLKVLLKKMEELVKNNREEINSFSSNGYSAIYYALLQVEEEI